MQLLQLRAALVATFLQCCGQTGKLGELGFFLLQLPLDLCDGLISLLNRNGVLFAFLFSLRNVASRAFNEVAEFFRALPIELHAAAVRSDFTFQSLHLRARVGDLNIYVVQCAAFFSQRIFAFVNPGARLVLGFGEAFRLFVTLSELGFERVELLARVMRLKNAQV